MFIQKGFIILNKIVLILFLMLVSVFAEESLNNTNVLQQNHMLNKNKVPENVDNIFTVYDSLSSGISKINRNISLRKVVNPSIFDDFLGEWQIAFKILDVYTYPITLNEIIYLDDTYGYVATGFIQYTPQSTKIPLMCFYDDTNVWPRNDLTCLGNDGQYYIWYYLNQINSSTIIGEYDITTTVDEASTHYINEQTFFLLGIKKVTKTVIIPF